MGWNDARNEGDHALMRIVALLFALASLAERAGNLPRPVRSAALWFLLPAEAVAWEFVTGQGYGRDAPDTFCGANPATSLAKRRSWTRPDAGRKKP